jgi:hypothetical protein
LCISPRAVAMHLPLVYGHIGAAPAAGAGGAGRLAEADGLRSAARAMVNAIAERVPLPELRQSFLARAEVQALDARV